RSVGYVVGPYVRRGALVSTDYDTVNLLRTIEDVLGIAPMGLTDGLARPMAELFQLQPRANGWRGLAGDDLAYPTVRHGRDLSLEAGLLSRLSIYANAMIAQSLGQSEVGSVAVQAGARVLLTPPRYQRVRVMAQAAFLREFGSELGVVGEVTGTVDVGRVRL